MIFKNNDNLIVVKNIKEDPIGEENIVNIHISNNHVRKKRGIHHKNIHTGFSGNVEAHEAWEYMYLDEVNDKVVALIKNDRIYDLVEQSEQVKDMLLGRDIEAVTLAYDAIMHGFKLPSNLILE